MFEGNFQVQAPEGLYSEGFIHGGAYFRNFTMWTEKDKKEWGLVRRGDVVSGLFFRSCSLGSLFLASILKVIEIATASNVRSS